MKAIIIAYIILLSGYFYYLHSFQTIAMKQLNQLQFVSASLYDVSNYYANQ